MCLAAEPLVVEEERKKSAFHFPTSSARLQWARHLAMQRQHTNTHGKNQQCITQKFGPAQMSNGETSICCCEDQRGTDKRLVWVNYSAEVRAGMRLREGPQSFSARKLFLSISCDVVPQRWADSRTARAGCQGRPAGVRVEKRPWRLSPSQRTQR